MLSIIWNITNRCPWNCDFCVMDADMNRRRDELSCHDKSITAINHLKGVDCRVDLSGGEVMLNRKEHLPLIAALSRAVGKERIGISCSGAYIGESEADFLAENVGDVEMTMDAHPKRNFPRRPAGYHATAAKATDLLTARGVRVGLQTVVTRDHLNNPELLDELHGWLCGHDVSEWSLIRYFPSGRGVSFPELALSDEENLLLVTRARNLCGRGGKLKLDVHYLMPGTDKDANCRCVRKSVGILPNGDVTSCFWGLDRKGGISDSRFLLGNITENPLVNILSGENARYWSNYRGCCPLDAKGGDNNVFAA